MEIRDYLRAIRRWLWLPLIIPLVAAGLTGYLLHRQPSVYQANATVIVPAVSAKGFSTSAASQYVATFKDVLVSQPVVDKVSRATGVPAKELVTGLSASTATASSNVLHVTYLGRKGENITAVVREATVDALDAVAQPSLVQAQNAVVAGRTQLQDANGAIQKFTETSGLILPQEQFKTKQQELSQLELQLQQTVLANDTAREATLKTVIAQREAALTALGSQVSLYTSLTDARQAALSVRDRAAQELVNAEALVTANHGSSTVSVQNIGRVSNLANVLKFTGIAHAVALLLALGFILLMELMRGRRTGVLATPAQTDLRERRGDTLPLHVPEESPGAMRAHGHSDLSEETVDGELPGWSFAGRPQVLGTPLNGNGSRNGNGAPASAVSDVLAAQRERRRQSRLDAAADAVNRRR